MDNDIDISIDFAGLSLANPVVTASGTCGYADELDDFIDTNRLGAFITKSITPKPRKGNPTPRIVETDSGIINAIGLANVGLEKFIEEKLPLLKKISPPVFVNVAGETIEDYLKVTDRLSNEDAIAGFELNISCPNVKKGGITFGAQPRQVNEITSVVKQAAKNKILIVKLSPSVTDITAIARAAVEAGADALSLINTFTAMAVDIETKKPVLANRTGGLSGPAVKPIALYLVNRVYKELARHRNIPILGLGGIRNASDAIRFIIAGASAVGIGTATFLEPDSPVKIIEGIKKYCKRKQIQSITQLIGSLENRY